MDLWETRQLALVALARELRKEAELLEEGFDLLETLAGALERQTPGSAFTRMTSVTLVKIRNLCHCCLSLELDGHGQESGAIGRVLLESVELLAYINADPTMRTEELVEGRLPPAGQRAKAVGGRLQGLRQHWNAHASHFAATYEASSHLVDWESGRLRLRQPFRPHMVRSNLQDLLAFMISGCTEGCRTLGLALRVGVGSQAEIDEFGRCCNRTGLLRRNTLDLLSPEFRARLDRPGAP